MRDSIKLRAVQPRRDRKSSWGKELDTGVSAFAFVNWFVVVSNDLVGIRSFPATKPQSNVWLLMRQCSFENAGVPKVSVCLSLAGLGKIDYWRVCSA